MDAKPIWLSRTFWVNVLTPLLTLAIYLLGILPVDYQPWAIPLLGVVNVLLRLVTTQPVAILPPGN